MPSRLARSLLRARSFKGEGRSRFSEIVPSQTKILHSSLFTLLICGCGSDVTLVPPGRPVMLGEAAQARIAVPDGHGGWTLSKNRVQIPKGWYAVPPPAPAPATRPPGPLPVDRLATATTPDF